MDYEVKRGLGFVALGVAAFFVGLAAREMEGGAQPVFQVTGFLGFVLVITGLVIAGKALLANGDD